MNSFLDKQCKDVVEIDGRIIIFGDGVKQCKSGRKMIWVKRYSQSSESMAKLTMIWGHLLGAIGLLTGNISDKMFCTLINTGIEDGNNTIRKWKNEDYVKKTHVVQIVDQGIKFLKETSHSYSYELDRYFLSREVIKTISSVNEETKIITGISKNSMVIITKLKRNCIGYEEPKRVEGPKK